MKKKPGSTDQSANVYMKSTNSAHSSADTNRTGLATIREPDIGAGSGDLHPAT